MIIVTGFFFRTLVYIIYLLNKNNLYWNVLNCKCVPTTVHCRLKLLPHAIAFTCRMIVWCPYPKSTIWILPQIFNFENRPNWFRVPGTPRRAFPSSFAYHLSIKFIWVITPGTRPSWIVTPSVNDILFTIESAMPVHGGGFKPRLNEPLILKNICILAIRNALKKNTVFSGWPWWGVHPTCYISTCPYPPIVDVYDTTLIFTVNFQFVYVVAFPSIYLVTLFFFFLCESSCLPYYF